MWLEHHDGRCGANAVSPAGVVANSRQTPVRGQTDGARDVVDSHLSFDHIGISQILLGNSFERAVHKWLFQPVSVRHLAGITSENLYCKTIAYY